MGILTPSTSEWDCFGDEAFTQVVKLKPGAEVIPNPVWLISLCKRKLGHRAKLTGQKPCEDEGRDLKVEDRGLE